MSAFFASLLAALLGALADALVRSAGNQRRRREMLLLDQLKQRQEVDAINAKIDKAIAEEADLRVLLDRL